MIEILKAFISALLSPKNANKAYIAKPLSPPPIVQPEPIKEVIEPMQESLDWTDPNAKVSKYFTVKEVLWLPGESRIANESDGLDEATKANLLELFSKLDQLREAYGKAMSPTSVYRTMKSHIRIYNNKGIYDQSKIPMKSAHLFGMAVDIADGKNELQKWCLSNESKLQELGLWCEDFKYTKTWVHFQTRPASRRFFVP